MSQRLALASQMVLKQSIEGAMEMKNTMKIAKDEIARTTCFCLDCDLVAFVLDWWDMPGRSINLMMKTYSRKINMHSMIILHLSAVSIGYCIIFRPHNAVGIPHVANAIRYRVNLLFLFIL